MANNIKLGVSKYRTNFFQYLAVKFHRASHISCIKEVVLNAKALSFSTKVGVSFVCSLVCFDNSSKKFTECLLCTYKHRSLYEFCALTQSLEQLYKAGPISTSTLQMKRLTACIDEAGQGLKVVSGRTRIYTQLVQLDHAVKNHTTPPLQELITELTAKYSLIHSK